ncbi:MAG: hypothetical protein ABSF45_15570 [Terriglobia bacterium]|jgi:hypothetical protein
MMSTHDDLRKLVKMLPVVIMSWALYAFLMLSSSKAALPAAIILLGILEVVELKRMYKEFGWVYVGCEVAYFPVLMLFVWAVYHDLLVNHPTFVLATIFYRPFFTLFCNRRLAFGMGLAILVATLPIATGIVTDPDFVDLLTTLYALLVAGLWAFCSKLGASVFGFGPGERVF